ncbi:MAG: hypothetical protein J7623_17070 [Chitinophaga sp.]|uniref:glycosyltransferase family 9 protein n=1 Tax=Chitinophaga sp. TaxID=1869181 RepID=UPI001B240EB2|nr:hypothetical protein [Chitinophaga sp.]MBO9730355.1 hypothetical protein [Chitinophaga sp.]
MNNNLSLNNTKVKRVLILYDEGKFFLGDSCITLSRLAISRLFFGEETEIDLNCCNKEARALYGALTKNNPAFSNVTCFHYDEIDYEHYDLIICMTIHEDQLLGLLHKRAMQAGNLGQLSICIFSFSHLLLIPRQDSALIFPVHQELLDFYQGYLDKPHEIFIDEPEKIWANKWLAAKGVAPNDHLFIFVDSSSSTMKNVSWDVYFNVLKFCLQEAHHKILIFDEKGAGKAEFYGQWLSATEMQQVIFSTQMTLREDISLLGADCVKMIFGPCTGLMHCASSVYNQFVNQGMPIEEVPLLVTYTGKWDAMEWWSNAPLINCLVIRLVNGEKQMFRLSDLSEKQKIDFSDRLHSNEYTAGMLVDFLESNLVG